MTAPVPPVRSRQILAPRRTGPLTAELLREPGHFGLGQVPAGRAPDATASMICGYCSTGCSLDVHLQGGRPVNLTPSQLYPVNRGTACPKGWEALTPLDAPDRATVPLIRSSSGRMEPVTWEHAIAHFVDGVRQVQAAHGPDSMAFLGSGQLPNEELALLGGLAKFGLGMRHGDGNTRQCMATSVVAYKEAFGFDAPPYTYADFEESDVIVLIGSNLAIAHPILWERISRNRHEPEIVVIDPRATETAVAAHQHLALRPKSDLALLYGVAGALIERDAVDRDFIGAHTVGFEDLCGFLSAHNLETAASASGLTIDALDRLVATIAAGQRVSFWWTMGVNQSHEGVRTAQAIINLALMTGNIGRPGTGANSITGQCNAMGSRLFSNTSSLYGGRDFANSEHRAQVAEILSIPESVIPRDAGWAYDQIIEGIASGDIRGLWVVGTNTAHSWINQSDLHDLLGRLDFLVVQDIYPTTETAERADLVLPAAGWGEKEGTFVNSERRIGVIKNVHPTPGDALADFWIFKLIAEEAGCGDWFETWTDPEATFNLLKALTVGRPCDISGLGTYADIDRAGGVQWPLPSSEARGNQDPDGALGTGNEVDRSASERRLFGDGQFFHPDGRARFCFEESRRPRETTSRAYPLVLLTGRGSSSQWHTGTRTSKSAVLAYLSPAEIYVEISHEDAAVRSIEPHEEVMVESPRGSLRARAEILSAIQPGQVFVPMHFAETNQLTYAAFDPYSRQPSYKYAAVEVRRLAAWERTSPQSR